MAIVSNNNAATKNVREKLGEFKFIVASLGSLENQRNFFDSQSSAYPDWLGHRPEADLEKLTVETAALRKQLEIMFEKQNRLAELRMELAGWKNNISSGSTGSLFRCRLKRLRRYRNGF